MGISEYLPFWDKLTAFQQQQLQGSATQLRFKEGELLHQGAGDCVGLFIVVDGQLRSYHLTEDGKEITLYRLLPRDICLFSASCMMPSIAFDVIIQCQEDTTVWHIPTGVYQSIMEQSAPVANFTNALMATNFSDVMWLMDQMLSKKLDSRIAALLLEEADLRGTNVIPMTHEQLAGHLGTVREVVTRVLKYLQDEGLIRLTRGNITLENTEALHAIARDSLR